MPHFINSGVKSTVHALLNSAHIIATVDAHGYDIVALMSLMFTLSPEGEKKGCQRKCAWVCSRLTAAYTLLAAQVFMYFFSSILSMRRPAWIRGHILQLHVHHNFLTSMHEALYSL